jgi:hypothetical protein
MGGGSSPDGIMQAFQAGLRECGMKRAIRPLIAGGGLALVCGLLLLWAVQGSMRAQMSCDNPPINVRGLRFTWDLTDFCKFTDGVFDEIISGGVPRDGIPPIDNPVFESVAQAATWLQPQSPVIAFTLGETTRAYPLAILTQHEIVNDVIEGMPVAVTFCPLCNSAVVFDRTVEGRVLRLGVSGLLRNSDLIMWDDVTQSWWQQFTGEAIVGAYTGTTLTLLPSTVVGFGVFADTFPQGEVLSRGGRGYGGNPYIGYDSSDRPFLFQGTPDARLFPTERVLGVQLRGQAVAYPFPILARERVINDLIGDAPVVAFWQPGAASALDRGNIDASRDVGMAALYSRAIGDQTLTFRIDADGVIRDDQTDSTWNIFGMATAGELQGAQLRQQLAFPHFWFAWAAFRPETRIYAGGG